MVRPPIKRLGVLVVFLFLCVGLLLIIRLRGPFRTRSSTSSSNSKTEQLISQLWALTAREGNLDGTVWAKERRAERCGAVFDSLWDDLNKATNKLDLLASFQMNEIVLGKFDAPRQFPHEIELREPVGSGPVLSQNDWKVFVADTARAGWELAQIEFRHRTFDTDASGEPIQSHFHFRADVTNTVRIELATLEGDLIVDWLPKEQGVKRVDASHVAIKSRRGPPPFQPVLVETIQPLPNWLLIDPLILYDLDGDGLSEIILPSKNLVYHRRSLDHFEVELFCKHPVNRVHTGIVADFDGDGSADFLCVTGDGLFLFKGSGRGTFEEPGRLVWAANPPLKWGQVLTCGDIDHDGDLDVFLGQYKPPYFGGQMPTPYYNANDGDPAYLLINDGHGNFTDATESSGLDAKRWRRSYSGSFARLDGHEHLDLLVVSDFAGLDLYCNDGRGHFTEVTRQSLDDPVSFGMGHALADFNADGRLDLLMIGMDSPTVDRLEHLGLRRLDVTEDRTMRSRVAFGNRLYLAQSDGRFQQTAFNDSIAHSGWSWGCSTFDFDNDGFPDVYVANGHESKRFVRDYEPEFWLHDIYVGHSQKDEAARVYFQNKIDLTRGRGQSYGGYEKNRLYLNRGGTSFLEIGYLMGLGLEQDCRNVMTDDLDGDGRMDLLVTTMELWPEAKQTLRVYRNALSDSGNWIGFRFREEEAGKSPVGTSVTLHYQGRSAVRQLVTGDSYRSQSANTLHFGLGNNTHVERAEIVWANGQKLLLTQPKVNQYHLIQVPR